MVPIAIFKILKSKYTYVILAGLIIVAGAWYINRVYEKALEVAYYQGQSDMHAELNKSVILSYETQLVENQIEIEKLSSALDEEKKVSTDLRKMLLIDHDLDRLLQQKPGMILKRVNEGTQQIYEELEAISSE